ncbi:hypothetical protein ACP70R_032309 [Stipagrostis hirtigluma subsp. patula]
MIRNCKDDLYLRALISAGLSTSISPNITAAATAIDLPFSVGRSLLFATVPNGVAAGLFRLAGAGAGAVAMGVANGCASPSPKALSFASGAVQRFRPTTVRERARPIGKVGRAGLEEHVGLIWIHFSYYCGTAGLTKDELLQEVEGLLAKMRRLMVNQNARSNGEHTLEHP